MLVAGNERLVQGGQVRLEQRHEHVHVVLVGAQVPGKVHPVVVVDAVLELLNLGRA